MKNQTLALSGINLKDNSSFHMCITASNPFMLGIKYQNLNNDLFIESWNLVNNDWDSGNSGLNAGAYLCETLEELTGLNLA
jgi:hypothetical protein|tara:strand:+ start:394 stop:636 length:243 start_codon:yes stop_codon:yes gene_type:complete